MRSSTAGWQGIVWLGRVSLGGARPGKAGWDRSGTASRGKTRSGVSVQAKAWQSRIGWARRGIVRSGGARQSRRGLVGLGVCGALQVEAGAAALGSARCRVVSQGRHGSAWLGAGRYVWARCGSRGSRWVRQGAARRGPVRHRCGAVQYGSAWMAGLATLGKARPRASRYGVAGLGRRGVVGPGSVRFVPTRSGMAGGACLRSARCCWAWHGRAVQAVHGSARDGLGSVRLVPVWQSRLGQSLLGSAGPGPACCGSQGIARLGLAWPRRCWDWCGSQGTARLGGLSPVRVRPGQGTAGSVRFGTARRGQARCGSQGAVSSGGAWFGPFRRGRLSTSWHGACGRGSVGLGRLG